MSGSTQIVVSGGTVHGVGPADVVIGDGVVVAVGPDLAAGARDGAVFLDATGCLVAPGLIDLLTDTGGPGQQERETPTAVRRAAAAGGYTSMLVTSTAAAPIDSPAAVAERRDVDAGPLAGALTVGHRNLELAPMRMMVEAGISWFTDGGVVVPSADLLRHALEYGTALGARFALRADLVDLGAGGVMHEGVWSSRLGLPGRPEAAEVLGVQRLLALVELTGARVHVHTLSSPAAVQLVAQARRSGLAVTADVGINHLLFSDEDCAGYDPCHRFEPPLRPAADREALRQAVLDGLVDAVVADHVPCTPQDKELPFDQAPPGCIGLETTLAALVDCCGVPLERAVDLLGNGPARVLGQQAHAIAVGAPADLVVIDPTAQWEVPHDGGHSRSSNTALVGRSLRSRVRHTVNGGRITLDDTTVTEGAR